VGLLLALIDRFKSCPDADPTVRIEKRPHHHSMAAIQVTDERAVAVVIAEME
jgi:hypothetical protein